MPGTDGRGTELPAQNIVRTDDANAANLCQNQCDRTVRQEMQDNNRSLLVALVFSTIFVQGREARMRRGFKGLLLASFLSFAPFSVHLGLAQSPWADCAAKTSDRIIAGCTKILAGGSKTPVRERVLAYINRGIAYYDRGELDRALADYTSAIRLDPKNAEALSNRADLKLRKGDIEFAIEDYSAAIEINPKLAGAFNGRGNALRETGQIDRAISDYEKAIALDPNSPFAYNGRGNALRDKGQADRAIEDFNKAIRIDLSYGTAFIGRANVFSDKGDWAEAIKDYDAALDLDPKDITALNNRGTAYQNMGSLRFGDTRLHRSRRAGWPPRRALLQPGARLPREGRRAEGL